MLFVADGICDFAVFHLRCPQDQGVKFVFPLQWGGDGSRNCDLQLQWDKNYCPVPRVELGPARKTSKLLRAVEQLVEGWGGTNGWFCGVVLNNNLFWALLDCQKGEMHLQMAGEPQLEWTAK